MKRKNPASHEPQTAVMGRWHRVDPRCRGDLVPRPPVAGSAGGCPAARAGATARLPAWAALDSGKQGISQASPPAGAARHIGFRGRLGDRKPHVAGTELDVALFSLEPLRIRWPSTARPSGMACVVFISVADHRVAIDRLGVPALVSRRCGGGFQADGIPGEPNRTADRS